MIARRWIHRAHGGLLRELDAAIDLGEPVPDAPPTSAEVSAWSVHQHLEHLWLADTTIVQWIRHAHDGTAIDDGRGFTIAGRIVLWLHAIPRRKGTAPDLTLPTDRPPSDVVGGLRSVRRDVENLEDALPALATSRIRRRHHLLGCYTPAEWMRFAHIHHVHHRRIIEDILTH